MAAIVRSRFGSAGRRGFGERRDLEIRLSRSPILEREVLLGYSRDLSYGRDKDCLIWVPVNRDERVGSKVSRNDALLKIGCRYTELRQVHDVLVANRITIEVLDPDPSKAGPEYEPVITASTLQLIVARATLDR
jgi:hypothetical protein